MTHKLSAIIAVNVILARVVKNPIKDNTISSIER